MADSTLYFPPKHNQGTSLSSSGVWSTMSITPAEHGGITGGIYVHYDEQEDDCHD